MSAKAKSKAKKAKAVVCTWCDEVVEPEQRVAEFPLLVMHPECAIRAIFGSVAHQRRDCSCYGGKDAEELVGLSKREAAQLALVEFSKHAQALIKQSPMRERAKRRPANFEQLSGEDQWAIDKSLGILDWDGT